jgi:hypothetical protein
MQQEVPAMAKTAPDEPTKEAARKLPPAAERALREAEDRRRQGTYDPKMPAEQGGRDGPDPVRYGDWEKNGIASDF